MNDEQVEIVAGVIYKAGLAGGVVLLRRDTRRMAVATLREIGDPAMHIIRRADGADIGEYSFYMCDGPDDWTVPEETHDSSCDEPGDYQILACRVVNTKTFGEAEDDGEEGSGA